MKKTNYLIPQTEAVEIFGETAVMLLDSPSGPQPGAAPERGGYAPGGGDLGGVPAR